MDGFDELMTLMRLVSDIPKARQRLEDLQAAASVAAAREQAAVGAEASLAAAKAAQEAEIAEKREELKAYHSTVLAEKREAEAKLERVEAIAGEMRQLDEQMRYAVMNHHGLLVHYNPRLMDFPTWHQIDASVLGQRSDAHFAEAPDGQFEVEPVPNRVAGSNLTRSVERRSMRRVQPDA